MASQVKLSAREVFEVVNQLRGRIEERAERAAERLQSMEPGTPEYFTAFNRWNCLESELDGISMVYSQLHLAFDRKEIRK